MKEELYKLIKEMEEIRGIWDGKQAGLKEERAMWATEVIEITQELIKKIEERV